MKMDTKSRVAIAAILDVAVNGRSRPVSLAEISERQQVSLSYLEQLFQKLRQKGFVASYRGPGGGYQLSRKLATISVADVINAVDRDPFDRSRCKSGDRFQDAHVGTTESLWCRVSDHLQEYLRSVTLDSVLGDTVESAKPRRTKASYAATAISQRGEPAAAMP
jgi:Rrf2 family transcriptional regulator, iron-sulfur cluster assembly transcription factor